MANIIFINKQHKNIFHINIKYFMTYILFKISSYFGVYTINLPGILLDNKKFLVDSITLKIFKTSLFKILHILCFCWSSSFDLIGYNFNLQKKLKKNILRLNLGFSKHKILVYFKKNIRIFGHKRYFTVFSSSIEMYYIVTNFFLNLRNIFPYKKRGLVPAIIPSIWIKPGKKTKFK